MSKQPVCLVTGASGGIGQGIAKRCFEEGWYVIGTDLRHPEEASSFHRFACVDLMDAKAIEELFVSVAEQEGRLDLLVNNAAYALYCPMELTSVEELDRTLHTNLRAPFLCIREAVSLLSHSSRASVVNISSVHATQTSIYIAAYAASKGGLSALSRALAIELAPFGIRVNVISPGAVDTEMLRSGLSRGLAKGETVEERLEQLKQAHPLQQIGLPEDIAEAVLFLASEKQSRFVTGATLVVDGGATIRLSTE